MTYEYSETVRQITEMEKNIMSYSPNFSKEKIQRLLDLEPQEYEGITFEDLINLYERNQKIIQASQSGFFARENAVKPATVQSTEIEQKLQTMTQETLEKAKEISLIEPVITPKEPESKSSSPKKEEEKIEFEHKEEQKIEFEPPKTSTSTDGIEIEIEKQEKNKPETQVVLEGPGPNKKIEKPTMPQILTEEEPAQAVHAVQTQVQMTLGEGRGDPTAVKRRMLELTKELFKEKGTSRREQIKMEIAVLKNMLVPGSKSTERKEGINQGSIREGLIKAQKSELYTLKESIVTKKRNQIDQYKKSFIEELSLEENQEMRKKIFDKFVTELSEIIEKLPQELETGKNTVIVKHKEQMKAAGSEGTDQMETEYNAEFEEIKQTIAKEIDTSIDFASQRAYGKTGEEVDTIDEINSMDEASLLNYLKIKSPQEYNQYEKSAITKDQAIKSAKRQMAKERGINAQKIERYIGE
ncbi:hypothetical protein HY990_04725 [Candidatus Micrarchaeota archaeon]|nr:hypothetical protein [Candidatus Micrarchaeota archaeon]